MSKLTKPFKFVLFTVSMLPMILKFSRGCKDIITKTANFKAFPGLENTFQGDSRKSRTPTNHVYLLVDGFWGYSQGVHEWPPLTLYNNIIIYLFCIAPNPYVVQSASQLKVMTLNR